MPPRPTFGPPVGLRLAAVAKQVSRAFDDALAAAGGSRPTWLILMTLRRGSGSSSQSEVADAIGIRGATLSHHLTAMERDELINRVRSDTDRRNVAVTLTREGLARFDTLRAVAQQFDSRLRRGLDDEQVQQLFDLLAQLERNVEESG